MLLVCVHVVCVQVFACTEGDNTGPQDVCTLSESIVYILLRWCMDHGVTPNFSGAVTCPPCSADQASPTLANRGKKLYIVGWRI